MSNTMWDGFVIDGAVPQISNFEIAFVTFMSSKYIFILTDVPTCNCLNRKKKQLTQSEIPKKNMFLARNTGYITEKWSVLYLLINDFQGSSYFLKVALKNFQVKQKFKVKYFCCLNLYCPRCFKLFSVSIINISLIFKRLCNLKKVL